MMKSYAKEGILNKGHMLKQSIIKQGYSKKVYKNLNKINICWKNKQ